MKVLVWFGVFTIMIFYCLTTTAQQPQPYFRFQYQNNTHHWQAFHTPAFHIYFPAGYDSLCKQVAMDIPTCSAVIHNRMNTSMQAVPNIIIYPSPDQLYQSNVGSFDKDSKSLPTFMLKGSRLLLAYQGDEEKMKQQLLEGVARATWESTLNEGLEEQVTGEFRRRVPYWIKEGMICYFAHGWPVEQEDNILSLLGDISLHNWDALIARNPALAGQAFCYFLSIKYASQAPSQLFFQFRKRKPLSRALRLVTKEEMPQLFEDCMEFYRQRILVLPNDQSIKWLSIAHNRGRILHTLINPNQTAIAYVLATWHRRTVYLYDLNSKRHHRLASYQLPPWINDHISDDYPLISWSKTGSELLITKPYKGHIAINRYSITGDVRDYYPMTGLDGTSTVTMLDNNNFLLAAWNKAQSDIVSYDPFKGKFTPLTNDRFDDKEPVVNEKYKVLYFVSKRPLTTNEDDSICWQGIFRLKEGKIDFVTGDILGDQRWDNLHVLPDGPIIATTTHNGRQQFTALSDQPHPGPLFQPAQIDTRGKGVFFNHSNDDSLFITSQNLEHWLSDSIADKPSPWQIDHQRASAFKIREDSILKAATNSERSFMDGIFNKADVAQKYAGRLDSIRIALRYDPKKVSPYLLQLYSAYFTAKVNNDYLINRYQPYAAYQGQFRFPQLGGMTQGGFSDLFENHHFNIAYRLPAGTEGSDFFIKYRNTAKLLDWGLAYYRKSEQLQAAPNRNWVDEDGRPYPNTARVKTNYYELSFEYPQSYFSGIQFMMAARQDKTVFQATEKYSLDFPAFKSLWGLFTLSYQYNHLQGTVPLLYKGISCKLSIDGFKGFTQQQKALAGLSIKAAYHVPLYKYITLVAQLQAGYSAGDYGILYNLGGLDNNITPRADSTVHFAQAAPYAFQMLVTPLRGYFQNSVYGSRYALLNVDIYLPLFQTLIPMETSLSCINNMQLGLFADAADAGGAAAYSTKGNGWRVALGFSGRTTLAGYPLRFDMGWPGTFNSKPVWYLSLKL